MAFILTFLRTMTRRIIQLAGLGLLLLITAGIYAPGLISRYFLDDYFNLRQLGEVATAGYSWFIFGGVAGPTGRPLSLFTFALQHGAWPYQPWAFKAVNILLHLINGGLVFCFARLVSRALAPSVTRSSLFPLAVTALWLLQPMHVDTVLYVIQRMTELSALFILAGLCGFAWGRTSYPRWSVRRCYVVMSISIALGTLLALFSKENGILLPLYACVVDLTLLRGVQRPPCYRVWRALFLLLPVAVVAGYLVFNLGNELHGFSARPYTPWQRQLTEARVLMVYLYDLIAPRPGAFDLFHDDFPISHSLMAPASTLPAVAGIVLLLSLAVTMRRRIPAFSFAVLWFFGGQVLESTFLDLDIFFEHRNYLPSLGVAFLLAWGFVKLRERVSLQAPLTAAGVLYCSLVGAVTWQNVELWSQPLVQAEVWLQRHPRSPRALMNLENKRISAGDIDGSLALLDQMEQQYPDQIYPDLKRIAVTACVQHKPISFSAWDVAERKAGNGKRELFSTIGELAAVIPALISGDCPHLDHFKLLRLIETLAKNTNQRDRRGALYELAATLALRFGNISEGYDNLVKAVQYSPTIHRRVYLLEVTVALRLPTASADAYAAAQRAFKANPLAYIAYRKKMIKLGREVATLEKTYQPGTTEKGRATDESGSSQPAGRQ